MAAIFDTHAHYTAAAFDADREAVLSALPGKNVALVVDCGTDLESSLASLALGERYPFLHTAAGIHPESLIEEDASTRRRFGGDWRAELAAIRPLYEKVQTAYVDLETLGAPENLVENINTQADYQALLQGKS